MLRIISLTAALFLSVVLVGCGSLRSFDESGYVFKMTAYNNLDDKTNYYEVDQNGNKRECEKFEPNAEKVYYDDGSVLMLFRPGDDGGKLEFEFDEDNNLPKPLFEKIKTAGEKFAIREGSHDTWLTKLFECNGTYYIEAMLNVNISCPYYLLKLDEENLSFDQLWRGSEEKILDLRM